MSITVCHPAIEWPATPQGCPEPTGLAKFICAEAWLIASHPDPDAAMLRHRENLIGISYKLANAQMEKVRANVRKAKEGDASALRRAIHHQGQRYHVILARQILLGARGNAALPWQWFADTERNVHGI